jgi:hypothetical protein
MKRIIFKKKVMLIKIKNKNTFYCIMLRTHFSEKLLKKYSKKNENWTFIFVHFSKNDRRIQNEVSEIISIE